MYVTCSEHNFGYHGLVVLLQMLERRSAEFSGEGFAEQAQSCSFELELITSQKRYWRT